ncbi:T9SS type A sorting domain-containing protein [Owenweeksia hongkongensis]|uniref:T9SS type A sorting domain-containing protein n=1 Tax=Owenweeksia hongkongensis TaxID=253245 RepID=UPI003A90E766
MKTHYPSGVGPAPRWKLWRTASLILMIFFLFAGSASATHYRYGTISWKRVPGAAPGTCDIEVTVKQAWRTSFPWGTTPVLGGTVTTTSLTTTPMFGGPGGVGFVPIALKVTSINPVDDWFFGEWKDTLTLPSDTAHYMLAYGGCCRISSLINNSDDDFRSESIVTPCKKGNDSPVSTQIPIVKLPKGVAVNSFMVAATDPNVDPVSYRLATTAEASGVAFVSNPVGFSITSGGMASFSTVGKATGDLYNAFVYITDTAGASTMADFLIEIVDSSAAPIFDYAITPSPASCFEVKPGDTVKFTVKAFDPDAGDSVFISAVGLPAGAVLAPALPTPGGNPDSVVFTWYPSAADIGTTVISFTAEDTSGVSTSTSVCIVVSLKPIFAVPPTPPKGTHITVSCGDTIDFDVEAYDPDPADSVQIFKVEGKSMGGAKIPLYPGASFMPLPTPWANPTTGHFHWVVDSADWGMKHVFFTAKDGLGEVTEHEVPILVNTTPKFLSMPDTCLYVDSTYCYAIEVSDKDTAYGDSLVLFGFGLPGWMTFIDSGNGRGSLCGTPTAADLGLHAILLEADDVFHHDNGTALQAYVITVKSDSIIPPDTGCVAVEIHCPSDSTWELSTEKGSSDWGGDWFGATSLPHDSTYTLMAMVGQPYPWGGIPVLDSTEAIKADNNVSFYRKNITLTSTVDLNARIRMYMDDGAEVYINGHLILREENTELANWSGVPHDVRYHASGTITNGYAGNQMFDYAVGVSLDTIFVVGVNEVVVALRNLKGAANKGGFSFMLDVWADCPVDTPMLGMPVDSCVSDSSWRKSTVTTMPGSNTFPWVGVPSLPHDSTFTLPVEIGQPYPWFSILSVPGSYVIKAPSYTTFYRKEFILTDHVDVDARFRMYFDDNVELYINGFLMAIEDDIVGNSHFTGAHHDVLFTPGGASVNGFMGGDMFDGVSGEDLDGVLVTGTNVITIALRNRKPADKGGFSFRMDVTKGGSTVLAKSGENTSRQSQHVAQDGHFPVQVYPNPTSSGVMVAMPPIEMYTEGELILTDMNGKVLYTRDIALGEVSIMELDLSDYATGVYLLKVEAGEYRDVQRILKK